MQVICYKINIEDLDRCGGVVLLNAGWDIVSVEDNSLQAHRLYFVEKGSDLI